MDELFKELKQYDVSSLLKVDDQASQHLFIELLEKMKKAQETISSELDSPFLLEQIGKALLIDSVKKRFNEVCGQLDFIFSLCRQNGYTEESPYSFNDLDNHIWTGKINDNEYLSVTTYNIGYFVMKDYSGAFSVWEMFQDYPFMDEYKTYTIENALKNAGELKLYSDCIKGNDYPNRPNFSYFKEKLQSGESLNDKLIQLSGFSFLTSEDAGKFSRFDDFFETVKLTFEELTNEQ